MDPPAKWMIYIQKTISISCYNIVFIFVILVYFQLAVCTPGGVVLDARVVLHWSTLVICLKLYGWGEYKNPQSIQCGSVGLWSACIPTEFINY